MMVHFPIAEPGWQKLLQTEFKKDYFKKLLSGLKEERRQHVVFPAAGNVFRAFESTPYQQVKVVLLGQDPYHGEGQAHGLSFSVPAGIAVPRSLRNIFKELHNDLNLEIPAHGNLQSWAAEGVLLLNTVLTVREKSPKSHQGIGWEQFTDKVIQLLSDNREHLVFLLWGNDAQTKISLIDQTKHLILKAAHPSPFSASRGFFGCRHFSETNRYLQTMGISPVNWSL